MKRKIGEIFEYNGEWCQCVVAIQGCRECSFRTQDYCTRYSECFSVVRSDGRSVIFKKLEKVGEPYFNNEYNIWIQAYRPYITVTDIDILSTFISTKGDGLIHLEIKQTKEDMEEKKVKVSRENWDYLVDKLQYILADHLHGENLLEIDNPEEKKLNLKPFDLEKAKSGKPVCTRDGRKARILCYDFKQNEEYPILVAVENKDGKECALLYSNDGISEIYKSSNNELAMFLEKKEGWVNVYKMGARLETGGNIHKNQEEAVKHLDSDKQYIATVKIEWEE